MSSTSRYILPTRRRDSAKWRGPITKYQDVQILWKVLQRLETQGLFVKYSFESSLMFLVVCSIHKQGAGLNESELALEKLWAMSRDMQSIFMTLITELGGETSSQVYARMSGSSGVAHNLPPPPHSIIQAIP